MPTEVMIFLDPPYAAFLQDRFIASTLESDPNATLLPNTKMARILAEHGLEVHTADYLLAGRERGARNLYYSFGQLKNVPALQAMGNVELRGFFIPEPLVVWPKLYRSMDEIARHFERIYAYNAVADGYDMPGSLARAKLRSYRLAQPFEGVIEDLWANTERQNIILVNSNKVPANYRQELYSERIRATAHFGPKGKLDLYGLDWIDPIGAVFEAGKKNREFWGLSAARVIKRGIFPPYYQYRKQILQAYKGPLPEKRKTMSRYRFAICYENSIMKGYISEKIFDALYVGTIPIYLGAPDVSDWIPSACYIDMRQFKGYEDLERFLDGLSSAQLEAYREAGRDFLASQKFKPFSAQAFADLLLADLAGAS